MNLAILHYHLNRGGVTRVIENQILALDSVLEPADPWRVAVIYGGRREGWSEDLADRLRSIRLDSVEVPQLDYDTPDRQTGAQNQNPDDLSGQLTAALEDLGFAPRETVLQVHNHSLGKNRHLSAAVPRLAKHGYAVLLQIHDFVEDFRPDNYRRIAETVPQGPDGCGKLLYPQAANIHYAVLNSRDYGILKEAGTEPERLHLLPNPVPELAQLTSRSDARRRLKEQFGVAAEDHFLLYPVRCIRRKNVGETLLYSALAPPGTIVGLTLAPLNPAEVPVYTKWKQFAGELRLPCLFEVGSPGGLSFAENLAACDAVLTTSLAEGFGMAFLESWLAHRPLVGRDLPEITPDFAGLGVRFDWLRRRLSVPLDWVGAETFRRSVDRAYNQTMAAYNRPRQGNLDQLMQAKTAGGLVDFGDLDEPLQRRVIRTVCQGDRDRRRVLDCNPGLDEALRINPDSVSEAIRASEVIRQNVQAIKENYSLRPSGRRLLELIRQVAASPRGGPTQPLPRLERILDRFLDPGRFRLIRS